MSPCTARLDFFVSVFFFVFGSFFGRPFYFPARFA